MVTIRSYEPADEVGWLRCRVLSFLDSAFFDAVEREKERYTQPAIELVADDGGEVVGLLDLEAERRARERGLERLEAWARDDAHVQRWYESHGFTLIDGYLHVYLERDHLRALDGQAGELRLVKAFAHYTGDRPDEIRQRYGRVHDDVLYEKQL